MFSPWASFSPVSRALLEGGAPADDAAAGALLVQLLLQQSDLGLQPGVFQVLLDEHRQVAEVERLDHEVGRPLLHRAHGERDVRVRGHHDDRRGPPFHLHPVEQLDAVHVAQVDVQDDDLRLDVRQVLEELLPFVAEVDHIPGFAEDLLERIPENDLIISHQDPALMHGMKLPSCYPMFLKIRRAIVPSPSAGSIRISPPWRSMIWRDRARPSPVPVRFVVKKCSNSLFRSSAEMP